jgi:4-hydroxy-tetrahydrodipicolinate reductase
MIPPYIVERPAFQMVGAVDIDPDLKGRSLSDLCGMDTDPGVKVTDDLEEAAAGAQVAVITTVSEFAVLQPLLKQVIDLGLHVVSTCEELSYPWKTQPALSAKVDALARRKGVAVLGTGVNPGFLMDFLPSAATGVCRSVERVRIDRIQDASFRRLPFRQKIGAGLTLEEFRLRVDQKKIRHVGLTESMHMVAAGLGWDLDRTEDVVEPVVAEREIKGDGWTVAKGLAAGVNQSGRGYAGGEEVLTLTFRAAVGQENPRDQVTIVGTPEITLTIPGGVNGDVATCAIVTNAVASICDAQPGLRTMADIAPVTCKA